MEINEILKLADLFYKMSQPALKEDSSLLIEKSLYRLFGKPPMVLINSLSDAAYNNGNGSCDLKVSTLSGSTVVEFTKTQGSVNNQYMAMELNKNFSNKILLLLQKLQKEYPQIPVNEWDFFAKGFVQLVPAAG